MAGNEMPKQLEIHKEGEGDVLKSFGTKSQELQKQYTELQQTYSQLKKRLDELQAKRMMGLRAPELDGEAAVLVRQRLDKKLEKMADEFRNKIAEHNQAVAEGLRTPDDTTSAEVGMGNVKGSLNNILSSELSQWVEEAKNPEAMAKRMADQAKDGIAKRTKDLNDAMDIR